MSSRVSRLFCCLCRGNGLCTCALVSSVIGAVFPRVAGLPILPIFPRLFRDNTDFKLYVDSLYIATYRNVLDSVIRTDKMVGVMFDWMQGSSRMRYEQEGTDNEEAVRFRL